MGSYPAPIIRRQGGEHVIAVRSRVDRRAIAGWWTTVLVIALGGVLLGYVGAAAAWLVWSTVGRLDFTRDFSFAGKLVLTILGVAAIAVLYRMGLEVFAASLRS